MFCTNCGVEIGGSSRYCSNCGARFGHYVHPTTDAAAAREIGDPVRSSTTDGSEPLGLGTQSPDSRDSDTHATDDRPKRFYVLRHWTGDLSLPVSYWLNGSLGIGFVLAITAILGEVDPTNSWRGFALGGMVMIVCVVLVQFWQIVGTWRSSEKHESRGGSAFWAGAARIALVLGSFSAVGQFATNLAPMFSGFWQLGFGGEQENYQLRVLRDSSEIELTGLIGFGATNEVERQLSLYPTITTIHLNSHGGRTAEAHKLGRLISERKLTTTSSRECRSACTIAYAGGERRIMFKGAVFAFHQPSFPGVSELELTEAIARDKTYLLSRGIDASFIERIYATPSTEIWAPSEEELMASGFVTDFAGADEVGLSGLSPSAFDELERELLKSPGLAALKKYEVDAYGQLSNLIRDGFQRGRSLAELRAETMPLLNEVYTRRLPKASDEAVIAFMKLAVEQGRILERKGGLECLTMYDLPEGRGVGAAGINPLTEFPQEMQQRELQIMANVISSAAESPVVPGTMDSVDTELEGVIAPLVAKVGEDIRFLDQTAETEEEMAIKCDLYNSMLEILLDQPSHDAAAVMRAMLNTD